MPNFRPRSLSSDSYDHIRRFRPPRRHSYDRLPRRRSLSPEDFYRRPRRYSIDVPPSDYFFRRRRYSADYEPAMGRHGRIVRSYSLDGLLPDAERMRRYHSDPYLYDGYGPPGPYGSYRRRSFTDDRYGRGYGYGYGNGYGFGYGLGYDMYSRYPYETAGRPYFGYYRHPHSLQYVDAPMQYVRRQIQAPVQYIQRPAVQHVQYVREQLPPPVQYVQPRPVREIRYVQQPVVKPIEYVEPRVIVQEPIIERKRYKIDANLTPIDVGPSTVHVKYNNVNTDYDVMPATTTEVRDFKTYETQPMRVENSAYTAFVLQKDGAARMLEDRYLGKSNRRVENGQMNGRVENGYTSQYRNGYRGRDLDHILYFGRGKTKEVYDDVDWNNNNNYSKARIMP